MPEATVTLNNIQPKDVTARGEEVTLYEFETSDGRKYTTFKHDIAVAGAKLRGRLVTIDYGEKPWQKGDKSGTNYYLNSIKAADDGSLGTNGGDPGVAVDPRSDEVTPTYNISTPANKDVSIARAVALKAAVETATGAVLDNPTADEILEVANLYVDWLLTGTDRSVTTVESAVPELVKF